jgi:hypothetical protein
MDGNAQLAEVFADLFAGGGEHLFEFGVRGTSCA